VTPVELVLSKLPKAKRNGTGWQARCPAHNDRRPSLSIAEGDGGRALLHCHAGCTAEAVASALGLKMADLMPEAAPALPRRPGSKAPRPSCKTYATAAEAVAQLESRHGKPAARWTYHDAGGEPVGLVLRWNLADGGKDIRPVSKTAGGWGNVGMPEPRPLYALPELLARAGGRVYVTEGEKCADAARSVGLLATTSPHGSKSADKADWRPLTGRQVVILPDNDRAGRQYAETVAGILARLSPPAAVRFVELPELPEGGDIADWLNNRDSSEPEALRQQIEALADAAELVKPEPEAPGILPYLPFPVDALPEPVRSFATKAARALGCDVSFVALPLLAGLASAIGNTRRIQLKRGWTEPAIVWAVIVGDSGTLKSPALELALRPIRRRQREAMKRHTRAMEEYAPDLAHYERELTTWKRGKDDNDPPTKPAEPVPDRCYCDDITIEALAGLLVNQPRGLLLVRDELAGWLAGFDRYAQGKGGDVAKWLEVFGGRPVVVDRKSGNPRTIYIPQAAVSIAGGIQPETLRRALGIEHRENGLAARLLLSCPPRRPKRWTEADIDPQAEAAIGDVFSRLFDLQPDTNEDGDPRARIVTLTPAGKAVWIDFYNTHAAEHADLAGELSAVWSKLEGYAARLALLVHFIRWAGDDPAFVDSEAVDEASVAAGVELSRWFGHEARRLYAILAESDSERTRRRLVELIGRKGGTVTARELQQSSRLYRTAADAEAALAELVTAGFGRWEDRDPTAKGGRPTQVFRLNPAPCVYETPANPKKSEGFVDVDAVDGGPAANDWGEM